MTQASPSNEQIETEQALEKGMQRSERPMMSELAFTGKARKGSLPA